MISMFLSIFTIMAVGEVGEADKVEIYLTWMGDYLILSPVLHMMVGNLFFFYGFKHWVQIMYDEYDPDHLFWDFRTTINVFIWLDLVVCVGWCSNLSTSVWLSLADGEITLDHGYANARRRQVISVAELKRELDTCEFP